MTDSVRILAIRHGETDWNADGRLQGQIDISLNASGIQQAKLLAQSFAGSDIDAVYSSDLQRASQTAEILAHGLSRNVLLCKNFRERHFGYFQGLTFKQIEERAPHDALRWRQRDPDFVPGGEDGDGESLAAFSARVLKAVDEVAANHLGQKIAIVTHGGVLDAIYRAAAHLDIQAPRTWTLGNTCVSRLIWSSDGGLNLVSWADTSHLDCAGQEEISRIEPNAEF